MRIPWLALVLLIGAAAARAGSHAVGDTLEAFALEDQHGKLQRVDAARRILVFTRDMQADGLVKEALATDGAALLGAAGAVYVADVSGMPSLVLRLFALRKMRQRPYLMLLDTDGRLTARLPAVSGKVTVLALDGLRITGVQQLASAAELRRALAPAPP